MGNWLLKITIIKDIKDVLRSNCKFTTHKHKNYNKSYRRYVVPLSLSDSVEERDGEKHAINILIKSNW